MLNKNKTNGQFFCVKNIMQHFLLSCFTVCLVINILNINSKIISSALITYIGITSGLIFFFLWFKNLDKKDIKYKIILEICTATFLSCLVIIIISNLNILSTFNLELFKYIDHITTFILICSGSILLYTNKEAINQKILLENKKEIEEERKLISIFSKKYEVLKLSPLKKIIILFYKEGLVYVFLLLAIISFGFILRIWDLNYIQWSDTYNFLSAKALFQNGNFYYIRNLDYTYFTSLLFYIFKPSLITARVFPLIFGTLSIFLMYLLGKTVNKKVGIISALLFAISPITIEYSSIVREYSLNLFIFLLATIFLFSLFKKQFSLRWQIFYCFSILFGIYIYSLVTRNTTLPIILFGLLIFTLFFFFYERIKNKYYLFSLSIILLIIFNFLISIFDNFYSGFLWNINWFSVFFDSRIAYPMQWFNGVNINIFSILFIFLIPLFFKFGKKILLCYIVFFFYILLFVLKFQDNLSYTASRYLYHIQSLYIFIFAVVIYILFILFKSYFYKIFILIFILSCLIYIPNTILGANHYANPRNYNNGNYPRISSIGSRPDVKLFLNELDKLNIVKKNYPIILEGLDQSAIIYKFDYDMDKDRNYIIRNGIYTYYYDIGKNIYIEDEKNNLFGIKDAISNNKEGVFITYKEEYPEDNFKINNTLFTYVETFQPKKIYKWSN